MAKCKACGEIYADGSRFCPRCGTNVADDNVVIAEALQAAQKDFDRDSMATLDKSRITYVCSICGSINRIDQDKCVRCGKPRPRSEYVTALKRINASKAMNAEAETLVAPLPVQAEPVQEAEPVVQEPIAQPEPEVKQEVAPVQPIVQNVVPVCGQAGAITQPFVVVPYVDSMYPLRQYNPNQLYRYQPYTPEELAAMEAQRKAEEIAQRQAAEAAQALNAEAAPVCECGVDKKKIKSFGIGALILSIVLFIMGAMSVYNVIGLGLIDNIMNFELDAVIFGAGAVVVALMGLIGIIHGSVRIAGKCNCRGWIIGLFAIIGALAYNVGMAALLKGAISVDAILDYLAEGGVFNVAVYVIVALVHLIVCACSPRAKKCNCK
ncbi:MAG: zinc ribbon domain-containing protein [Clostridia bacterium]|nr:zinc ribbon domain-containing protein [Clostridia bacterium]